MRAIVCGGRDFTNYEVMDARLKELGVTFVIEGGASGADTLAWRWARRNLGKGSEHSMKFQARWDKHGKSAGPIRNQKMIDEGKPEIVVAFAGGRGTADMVRRAKRAGIKVYEFTSR